MTGWSSLKVENKGDNTGLPSDKAAARTDMDRYEQIGSSRFRKEGHVPGALQRWQVTKRASPELTPSAFIFSACRPCLGTGCLNRKSSSALPRGLLDFIPSQRKILGISKESGLGIIPTVALLLHDKWAYVTTSGAVFTTCYCKQDSRGQVCLAHPCAPSQHLEQWLPHCRISTDKHVAQGLPAFQAVLSKSHA